MADALSYDAILVATDGSKAAERAAGHAADLARASGATVHAIYVMDMGEADFVAVPSDIAETKERLKRKGQRFVDDVADTLDEAGVECVTVVKSGTPEDEIVEYAEEHGVDLIVMGKRGRSDPDKPFTGSTSRRVASMTDVPVHLV